MSDNILKKLGKVIKIAEDQARQHFEGCSGAALRKRWPSMGFLDCPPKPSSYFENHRDMLWNMSWIGNRKANLLAICASGAYGK